jgi:hypothetical protein
MSTLLTVALPAHQEKAYQITQKSITDTNSNMKYMAQQGV